MESLKVALLQFDIKYGDKNANIEAIETLVEEKHLETDILILPEMFSTGFSNNTSLAIPMNGNEVLWLNDSAKKYGCVIIGSLMIEEDGKFFNRLIVSFPDGRASLTYDKRHLFSLMQEDHYFSAGKKKLYFDYKGWKICPLICYDLRFPVWCRNTENADLIIFVANWPEKRHLHWSALLKARAIENQCYVVGVNRIGYDQNEIPHNGQSAVYDFWGNTLSLAENLHTITTVELTKSEIERHRNIFGFWKDADNFTIND
jgi:omega-amidase